jgi:hypothetical protein
MRVRATVGSFVVAAAASLAFAADEPKKYAIDEKEVWTAGQVVTVTRRESTDMEMTADGKQMRGEHASLEATYVLRADAVDEKGAWTKSTVWFRSWKRTKSGETDESISGARITVEDGVWRMEGARIASVEAGKWLDKKFGKSGGDDDDNPLKQLKPPKLAVGEVWKPDLKALDSLFTKALKGAPLDFANATMEVRLKSVSGASPDEVGEFEATFKFPIAGKPEGMPAGAKIEPGGVAEITGTHAGRLTTRTMLATDRFAATFAMKVSVAAGGRTVTMAVKGAMDQEESTVEGGTIPAPAGHASPDDLPPVPPSPAPAPPDKK